MKINFQLLIWTIVYVIHADYVYCIVWLDENYKDDK